MSIPALILAAGSSTRLRPFTDDLPKSLLPVAGVSMLERSMKHLVATGVREVVIVTGFQAAKLGAAVARWFPRLDVTLVDNPAFATTNNGYSLRCAAAALAGRPFVLLDSDLVYDGGILPELLASDRTALALRRSGDLGPEEVKIALDAAGDVAAVGKEVALDQAVGESVGLAVFDATSSRRLFHALDHRIAGLGLANEYYEAAFQELIDGGVAMGAVDIAPYRAMEVDTPADLAAAEALFGATPLPRLAAAGAPLPRVRA